MSTPKYRHGGWYLLRTTVGASYTGHIRKRRGRWWFFGDVCRDVKGLVSELTKYGSRIERP